MALPKHNEIRFKALELLHDGNDRKAQDFIKPLAIHYKLARDDVYRMYESGNGPIFLDRITWALSYLFKHGFVDKPIRGVYRINDTGKQILTRNDAEYLLLKTAHRKQATKTASGEKSPDITNQDKTPTEIFSESFNEIKNNACSEILELILTKTPTAFEHIVVELLQKMGYGEQIENSGIVTQRTNDKGIDGSIKEDVLGLNHIYTQAKRYAKSSKVGRVEIQNFVGALAIAKTEKGVFITTSAYTPAALEYAESLNGKPLLVLIDGEKLARYIYDFNLGMEVEKSIEIKKLNSEYWDIYENE